LNGEPKWNRKRGGAIPRQGGCQAKDRQNGAPDPAIRKMGGRPNAHRGGGGRKLAGTEQVNGATGKGQLREKTLKVVSGRKPTKTQLGVPDKRGSNTPEGNSTRKRSSGRQPEKPARPKRCGPTGCREKRGGIQRGKGPPR